jgi:hypothetical protein
MGSECQPQSVQKYKRILRAILNYGSDLGYLPVVPKFKIGRTRKARLVYLLDHEVDELLEVAAQKHPHMLGFCLLAPEKTTPSIGHFSDSHRALMRLKSTANHLPLALRGDPL